MNYKVFLINQSEQDGRSWGQIDFENTVKAKVFRCFVNMAETAEKWIVRVQGDFVFS